MKKSTVSTIAYSALLVTLCAFMPWGATSAAEFRSRAIWAIAVGVLVYLVLTYSLDLFAVRSNVQQNATSDRQRFRLGSTAFGLWGSIKLTCAASLAIGLAGIALGTSHLTSAVGAFFFVTVGQQLVFVFMEIVVARQQVAKLKLFPRALTLAALVLLAVLFAASSNITLLAQKPPAQPLFSDNMNLMFAIPALVVGLVSLLPWPAVRK